MAGSVGRRTLVFLTICQVVSAVPLASKSSADKAEQFVNKCRGHCISQLTPDNSRRRCLEDEQCLRCWASCKAFQSDHYIRDYCKRNKACTLGCRQACRFYLTQNGTPPSAAAPGADLSDPPPTAAPGADLSDPPPAAAPGADLSDPPSAAAPGADLSDPPPAAAPGTDLSDPPRAGPGQWVQPVPVSDTSVYSLVDGKIGQWEGKSAKDASDPERHSVMEDWTVRVAGMVFGPSLVSATVWWPPRGAGRRYVVTWELFSGGLRGHLVSEETSASLPLWPDEQYTIQVFSGDGASQPLQLDTHQPAALPSSEERSETAGKTDQATPGDAERAASKDTSGEPQRIGSEKLSTVPLHTVPAMTSEVSRQSTAMPGEITALNATKTAETTAAATRGISGAVSGAGSATVVSPALPVKAAPTSGAGSAAVVSPALPVKAAPTSGAGSAAETDPAPPASPLESASQLADVSDSSPPLPLTSSAGSASVPELNPASRWSASCVTLPLLLTLLLVVVLSAAAGLALGRRRRRLQQPCSCDQRLSAEQEASTDDQRTLLGSARTVRLSPLQGPAGQWWTPHLVVPRQKQ